MTWLFVLYGIGYVVLWPRFFGIVLDELGTTGADRIDFLGIVVLASILTLFWLPVVVITPIWRGVIGPAIDNYLDNRS